MQNFKTLACLYSWAGWFESYLVANPEDRFSRDVAHFVFIVLSNKLLICFQDELSQRLAKLRQM